MHSNHVDLAIGPEYAQKQVDLVNAGYQSRIRAIMSIYGVTRDEAEKIGSEIEVEQAKALSDFQSSAFLD